MKKFTLLLLAALSLVLPIASASYAQAESRGSAAVYPVVFDKTGTTTSRATAKSAMSEIFRKGGFKLLDDSKAVSAWRGTGFRAPTVSRPPTTRQLATFGRAAGVRYVCASQVTFHTRSIWVNLGPKTVSNCTISLTIVDASSGKIAYEAIGEGRSDERSNGLKVAAAILMTPIITAVSGGPKTPRESRAAQIASARALEGFVVVKQ